MKTKVALLTIYCFVVFSAIFHSNLYAQSAVNKDTMLVAALEIMNETTYCGLVTVDSTGKPQIRTMNPFPANDDLTTWFATARNSRKVRELRKNSNVCVYYSNHNAAKGYVTITGIAQVIDDKDLLKQMKRDYWSSIPNWEENFVLIKIIPKTVEVINYKHRLNNDPVTLRAPTISM